MVVVTVVDTGPLLLIEGRLPGVSTLRQPVVDSLAHLYAVFFTAEKKQWQEAQSHGRFITLKWLDVNCYCVSSFSSRAGCLFGLGHP